MHLRMLRLEKLNGKKPRTKDKLEPKPPCTGTTLDPVTSRLQDNYNAAGLGDSAALTSTHIFATQELTITAASE